MAKKGTSQLQVEVDNDESWEALVERDGLILADIYSDWCGPCGGMLGNLRKVKLEIGGETLILAAAKCNNITCLQRFKNKSQPTWMFISNKRMIRLLFGADAPKLVSILTEEIRLTKIAIAQRAQRDGIDFDQLTDEEQVVADEEARIQEEAERAECEAREQAINQRREDVVENLLEPLKDYTLVMTWPHVGNDGMTQILNAAKETTLTIVGKPVKHHLTEEDLYEMLYYSSREYSDMEKAELFKGDVTGLLFQGPAGEEESEVIDIFLEKFYGASKCPPGDEESLAVKLSIEIKIEPVEEEGEEQIRKSLMPEGQTGARKTVTPDTQNQSRKTVTSDPMQARKSKKGSITTSPRKSSVVEEENVNIIQIPGIYVPENARCVSLAMRILFPLVTLKFDLPEPEPIPPHLICAFDAFKKTEVLQLASEWPEGTMRLGFFTSAEAETAELLAKTAEQFDKMRAPYDAKLIVQVSKKKSEPLLSYSLLGPTYVSPDCVVGEKECDLLFPEGYDEPEPEPEPEVVVPKKKKKRGRGSKTSISTKSTGEMEETEEAEEGGSEEGLEEIDEEEEEEEGDDDDDGLDFMAGYEEPTDLVAPPPEAQEADKATTTESPPE